MGASGPCGIPLCTSGVTIEQRRWLAPRQRPRAATTTSAPVQSTTVDARSPQAPPSTTRAGSADQRRGRVGGGRRASARRAGSPTSSGADRPAWPGPGRSRGRGSAARRCAPSAAGRRGSAVRARTPLPAGRRLAGRAHGRGFGDQHRDRHLGRPVLEDRQHVLADRAGRRGRTRCRSGARRRRRRGARRRPEPRRRGRRPRRSAPRSPRARSPSQSACGGFAAADVVRRIVPALRDQRSRSRRRATSTRSRPLRSGRTPTSTSPAPSRERHRGRPCVSPISHTSQPPGASHRGAPATITSRASRPVGPGTRASTGSQSATSAGSGSVGGHVRRVRHDEVEPAGEVGRQRVPPVAVSQLDGRAAPAEPGEVGAGDGEGGQRGVGRDDTDVRMALGRESEGDGARAGAEIGHDGRRSLGQQPQRRLHDPLGLRPRDEHAPVDEQVELAEGPVPEHVLQRLAGAGAARPWP